MSFNFNEGMSRSERRAEIYRWATQNAENATRFLKEIGYLDANGNIAPIYQE